MSLSVSRHLRVLESLLRVISATGDAMQAILDDLDAERLEGLGDDPSSPPAAPEPPRRRSSSKMNAITPDRYEGYLRRIVERVATDAEKRRVMHIINESRDKRLIGDEVAAELLAIVCVPP